MHVISRWAIFWILITYVVADSVRNGEFYILLVCKLADLVLCHSQVHCRRESRIELMNSVGTISSIVSAGRVSDVEKLGDIFSQSRMHLGNILGCYHVC